MTCGVVGGTGNSRMRTPKPQEGSNNTLILASGLDMRGSHIRLVSSLHCMMYSISVRSDDGMVMLW